MAVAAEASPGMRLIRRGRRWVDSGIAPALHVMDAGGFDNERFDSPALHRPLDGSGPTCEVVLIPGTPTTLVFRAFHGITDARGLQLWATDVFRVLRGEPPLGYDATVNHHELVERVAGPELPTAPAYPLEWPSLLGHPAPNPTRWLWRRRTVDGRHPAAVAKVAAALAATTESGTARFFIPVDLRRHDLDLRSTGMLAHSLRVDVAAGEGWQQVHERLLGSLVKREELALPLGSWLLRVPVPMLRVLNSGIERSAARKRRYSGSGLLSHLGGIELAELSTEDFRAGAFYTLGSSSPGGPPEIDLVERPGRTEVTVAWHDEPGTAELVEGLLDTVTGALSAPAHRLWAGNRTERALPSDRSVVELFREQVERTPERIALSGPEGKVTYAELSRRADRVAAELRRQGVGSGTVVGLLADRTVAGVAGLWGCCGQGPATCHWTPGTPTPGSPTCWRTPGAATAWWSGPTTSATACRPAAGRCSWTSWPWTVTRPRTSRTRPSIRQVSFTSSTPRDRPVVPRAFRSSTTAWPTTCTGPPVPSRWTPTPGCR